LRLTTKNEISEHIENHAMKTKTEET